MPAQKLSNRIDFGMNRPVNAVLRRVHVARKGFNLVAVKNDSSMSGPHRPCATLIYQLVHDMLVDAHCIVVLFFYF
jgi:hypothetical protein